MDGLFEQELKKRILIFDGAMGTMIQEANLSPAHFGGESFDGCNEYLNVTAPDVIKQIHLDYLEAGADIISTNTFGGARLVLDDYDLGYLAPEINEAGAKLARLAADAFSTAQHPRFVAGALGPTTKTLSVTGGATFAQLQNDYEEQAIALLKGGVDLLVLETSQDTLNVKAAYNGITAAFDLLNKEVPLILSGTIEPMGTTLAGQSIEAFYISLAHTQPIAVGLNCATGPEFMAEHLRSLSELATTYTSCYPNAGLPDEDGLYHETPTSLAMKLAGFAEKGWLNIVGGCCGTTPAHIKAIAEAVRPYPPRTPNDSHPHAIAGIEALIYDDPAMKPILVGERTNVIGSRNFKNLIADEKYEEASEVARAQVQSGAQVIDVCLANPDRDELVDMERFLEFVTKRVKAPFMIDSTDFLVIEAALKMCQGKSIINSINLEDGEERFAEIVPLIKQYGAAVVVGTIDETGMALTAERKLAVAKRSYDLLVDTYGLNGQDIIFDPLVFPVGTGDEQYIGSANETVEGIRLIKEHLPETQTILGISNISFGLPPVGREILNAVFLYHCTKAGLDYALVNTERLKRFASIAPEEITLAEKLLFETTNETLAEFTAFYRGKKKEVVEKKTHLTLEERLASYIVEGTKDGLNEDLEKALAVYDAPLQIVNGPLMDGMAQVGILFNDNQLIVAEVLQSAEVMKAAVSFLEPHMDIGDASHSKGKIVLATVKGDVHDIGKNLVDIILSNNGFDVVDLGIKVTSAQLIEAIKKEQPDMVGLSGLLVKSAQQMTLTAQDFKEAGISLPVLVGGAALTRRFTSERISTVYGDGLVLYAKDAMAGLALANKVMDTSGYASLRAESDEKRAELSRRVAQAVEVTEVPQKEIRSNVSTTVPLLAPPDYDKHVLRQFDVSQIEPYINMQTLLGHHLGLKGNLARLLEQKDDKALDLKETVDALLQKIKAEKLIQPVAKYQFFPAQADGNDILIYDPKEQTKIIERFTFPRQQKEPFLCLADFLRPVDSGEMDSVGFLVVTAGKGVRQLGLQMKEAGNFFESHALQALALESAEALAERVHQLMRDKWGFPDPTDFTMQDRFAAKYRGQRFSFGYPACPNLEDQEKLFALLHPEEIGIKLTDGWMMDPEASVTAMVFSHPQARYFHV